MYIKCLCFIPILCVAIGNENINLKYKSYTLVGIRRFKYLFTAIVFPPSVSVWVNLYKNRKLRAIYRMRNNTQNDKYVKNVENKIKNKKTTENNIKTHKLSNLEVTNSSK